MRDDVARQDPPSISPGEWGPGYQLWRGLQSLSSQRGPEGTTSLIRMASHLALIVIAIAVLWVSRQELPQLDIPEAVIAESGTEEIVETAPAGNAAEENFALVRAAIPFTLIPERARLDIITHTVKSGDTLYGIATKYKLSAETIMFANGLESNPDLLRMGQQLIVLPVNGILHTVAKGDTLDKIAKKYKINASAIINYTWNRLDTTNPQIAVGQKLIVPGGVKEIPIRQVQVYTGAAPAGVRRGTGRFVWPTAGYVTQGYQRFHQALDIARSTGTPVKAADNGFVVVAGWSNDGYGNYIVIDHGNGYQTVYAHLSKIFVKVGNVVGQGAVIGNMGNTGRSTGPHLHFEIRKNGARVNPLSYLR